MMPDSVTNNSGNKLSAGRVLRWLPVVLAVCGIFALTFQNSSQNAGMSEAFRGLLVRVCERVGIDCTGVWWNSRSGVRHLGHVIEYFVLGICSGMALRKKWQAVALCLAVSAFDQAVKELIPVRHFDIHDIPFDIAGIAAGVLLSAIILKLTRVLYGLQQADDGIHGRVP